MADDKAKKNVRQYMIVILGDGGVGKTCLTTRMTLNHFVDQYDPTLEDTNRKQLVLDGQTCLLDILDVPGQQEYRALEEQYVESGECFVVAYSITSRPSFDRIRYYHEEITQVG
ncbi:RAS1 protein [Saxophila tyrrhenica]|uniref:RAS1 protein n=1 Tax=Saxophila tyrrhenica TaxID=1690608 RepID=A0AAV9P6Z6_9PEZI|nr:RAS1 protein [Saxophila tyrrhenica]